MDEDCVVFDLPEGLRLNLLGLIVEIEQILITADRAGVLGGLLASLICGEEPTPKPKPKPKPKPRGRDDALAALVQLSTPRKQT